MRRVCIVNNYNYELFLRDCLDSLVKQTIAFDKIVIIDDGSTDSSVEVIRSFMNQNGNIELVKKSNAGQLSCFNLATSLILSDDLIWLIDADDYFPNDYSELSERAWAVTQPDMLFVEAVQFQNLATGPVTSQISGNPRQTDFPITSALTRFARCWIGAPTSCLVMRGRLFLSLLPYPYESDWITRADDVLIFGASILGASKTYAPYLGIGYRVHSRNHFVGRSFSPIYFARRAFYLERLFNWYCLKAGVESNPGRQRALDELALVPKGLRRKFLIPSPFRILVPPLRKKVKNFLRLIVNR